MSRLNEEPNPKLIEALEVVEEEFSRDWERAIDKSGKIISKVSFNYSFLNENTHNSYNHKKMK